MKNLNYLFSALLVIGLIGFSSCGDDDDDEVTGTIQVSVSGLPAGGSASITIEGDGFSQEVTGTESITVAVGTYDVIVANSEVDGNVYVANESDIIIIVEPNQASSVAVAYEEFSAVNGIIGTWVSAGADVAPLLVNLFAVDSIIATFAANQTYTVLQYAGGATAPLTLSGTYSQTLAGGTIWEIVADQTVPAALTSEGIFQVDPSANPDSMQYEIAQTSPDIGAIPPNATDGFGSTSGGVLGTANVQVYKRRAY